MIWVEVNVGFEYLYQRFLEGRNFNLRNLRGRSNVGGLLIHSTNLIHYFTAPSAIQWCEKGASRSGSAKQEGDQHNLAEVV